jgi:hypothetical protein
MLAAWALPDMFLVRRLELLPAANHGMQEALQGRNKLGAAFMPQSLVKNLIHLVYSTKLKSNGTLRSKKSTIARCLSRTNCVRFSKNTESNLTNATSGIERFFVAPLWGLAHFRERQPRASLRFALG